MTDKQIIIYKKECYNEPYCSLNQVLEQLKRKEQECEELKERLIKCDDNIIIDCEYSKKDLCSFIHRKKEVINGLQEQLDQLKAERKEALEQLEFVRTLNTVKDAENRKLSKTLTEIKEIAEVNSINTCWTAINLCVDCDEIKECGLQSPFEKLKAIIQKISEVEDVGNQL